MQLARSVRRFPDVLSLTWFSSFVYVGARKFRALKEVAAINLASLKDTAPLDFIFFSCLGDSANIG